MNIFRGLPVFGLILLTRSFAGEPALTMPVGPDGIKRSTVPERVPLTPEPRGKPYKAPSTNWEQRPVLWGWNCELPDGTGLQFGGVHQLADDGRSHTCIREGGQWKPVIDELRKNNPLQKHCDAVWELRNGCKDALARARSIYFDGKTADEEIKNVKAEVDPLLLDVATKLAKQIGEFKPAVKSTDAATTSALKHLESAAALIKPIDAAVTPELLAGLRSAQIELEFASELLDAEPPPRALSLIAWDAKTKLFVLFGGDHTDYLTNDLWVFDPAKRKWTVRLPEMAPEPRADHYLESSTDGYVVMYGGYTRGQNYAHCGPARWIYDVEKNAWSAQGHTESLVPAGIRSAGYHPPSLPEKYMKGPRPDAAAHEAKLKAIPLNTWVRLNAPIPLGGRDWGTWVLDPDRDLYYVYAGGHASYAGNDVARYHLSTGRWEISDPTELPLGGAGTNEQYPAGVNFNQRPWCRNHVWNSQAYEPTLKKLINAGVTDTKLDAHFYIYDPDKADWTERHRITKGMNNSTYSMQVRGTPHGLVGWCDSSAWLLDAKTLQWKRLEVKGKMPGTTVDSCGMVYDTKRDRMLLLTLGGYAKPYDGQIHSLDMKTLEVSALSPEGMDASKSWRIFLREMAYDPTADMVICPQLLNRGGKHIAEKILGYDAASNRWVLITTPGATEKPFMHNSVCMSIAYDAKRGLFWCGDASWNGTMWVLRFDRAKAEIMPLKEIIPR